MGLIINLFCHCKKESDAFNYLLEILKNEINEINDKEFIEYLFYNELRITGIILYFRVIV